MMLILQIAVWTTIMIAALLPAAHAIETGYEVWAVDQSDESTGGARLYIWDGPAVVDSGCNATPIVVPLGEAGSATGPSFTRSVRPHMVAFDPTHMRAVISSTAASSLLVLDAGGDAVANLGLDAHAAFVSPTGQYILAADIGDAKLTLVTADFENDRYTIESQLSLKDVATGGAKKGPVCPVISSDGKTAFVTLNGGGLVVAGVDLSVGKLSVNDVYTATEMPGIGCGGVQLGRKLYLNTATPDPNEPEHVFVFDVQDLAGGGHPSPTRVVLKDVNDAHGLIAIGEDRYLWLFNRGSNDITVLDASSDSVVSTIDVATLNGASINLAPDLAAVSPDGRHVFVSTRGPFPRTANNPFFDNAVGSHPGVAVVAVEDGGRNGRLECIQAITSSRVDGVEQSDPHGIAIRRPPSLVAN